ncbi:hypothetical protein RRG08_003088 [Elysia crispata]|uniref:Uncharacterized protein n=1 Tax=Elysia crispata TaxID=231223 RepID=A0AAE1B8P3_9GAST|nr:hypothetical protein RRG08_003088 [Elysia crispata]
MLGKWKERSMFGAVHKLCFVASRELEEKEYVPSCTSTATVSLPQHLLGKLGEWKERSMFRAVHKLCFVASRELEEKEYVPSCTSTATVSWPQHLLGKLGEWKERSMFRAVHKLVALVLADNTRVVEETKHVQSFAQARKLSPIGWEYLGNGRNAVCYDLCLNHDCPGIFG